MTDRGASEPSTYSYSDFIQVKTRKKRKNKASTSTPLSIAKLLPQIQSLVGRDEWFAQSTRLSLVHCLSSKNHGSTLSCIFVEIIKFSWRDFSPALESGSAKILCLGLGSPSASQNARVQLAFLTETCKQLNIVSYCIPSEKKNIDSFSFCHLRLCLLVSPSSSLSTVRHDSTTPIIAIDRSFSFYESTSVMA